MTLAIVSLTVLLLVLAALLLNLNLYSAWSWRVKAFAVVATFATLGAAYQMLGQLLGWPIREPLPADVKVLAIQIQEPQKGGDKKGAVYLWARPVADPAARPRAYELAYSRLLHDAADSANRRLRAGRPQGARAGVPGPHATGGRGASVVFFDLEKPALPEKR